jgi:hypothetical protein
MKVEQTFCNEVGIIEVKSCATLASFVSSSTVDLNGLKYLSVDRVYIHTYGRGQKTTAIFKANMLAPKKCSTHILASFSCSKHLHANKLLLQTYLCCDINVLLLADTTLYISCSIYL